MSQATFEATGVRPGQNSEGTTTKAIETYTSQIPSGVYLSLAVGSIGLSLLAKANGKDHNALFFGQWVAPFLLLGIYNKLVKLEGSD